MKLLLSDNYFDFSCIGGDCSDSCCAKKWEIIVDKNSVKKYKNVQGAFGDKLRENIIEADDKAVFKMHNDRCAFLREDNLCEIYRELGEDSLCLTCTMYPRELQRYGDLIIGVLTPSCPEVCRMLFEHEGSIQFGLVDERQLNLLGVETVVEVEHETDRRMFHALIEGMTNSIAILQDGSISILVRLRLLLMYNESLGTIIRKGGDVKAFSENFFDTGFYRTLCDNLSNIKSDYLKKMGLLVKSIDVAKMGFSFEHIAAQAQSFIEKGMKCVAEENDDFVVWDYLSPQYAKWYENYGVYFLARYYMDAMKNKNPLGCVEKLIWMLNLWQGMIVLEERDLARPLSQAEHIRILNKIVIHVEHNSNTPERVRTEIINEHEAQMDYWLAVV